MTKKYQVVQQWEGTVAEVGDGTFVARLRDLTDLAQPAERAVFSLDEIHEDDVDLAAVGAVFYWAVGYLYQRNGQRRLSNELRFRRLPQWTEADLNALDEPSDLDELFDSD